jgi:hypothetical protein
MLVPAFAGSTPAFARMKGRAVPNTTDVWTIKNNEKDIAQALLTSLLVIYT